jgi:two-component system LytT family response regulator
MIKAIIVDDEERSRKNLAALLADFCEGVEVKDTVKSVDEAVVAIQKHHPDVVFLDIQMQRETGFDLLNRIERIDFEVIFTTAHAEYAIGAIRFAALDYLLKPIDIEELKQAVSRVENKRKVPSIQEQFETLLHNFRTPDTNNYRLAIPFAEGMVFVNMKDVLYCEAQGNYTQLYTKEGKSYLVSKTLKDYENLLIHHDFFRVHHSFLVNIKEIKQYIKVDGGYIVMSNNAQIGISQRKKDAFLKMIDGIILKPFGG